MLLRTSSVSTSYAACARRNAVPLVSASPLESGCVALAIFRNAIFSSVVVASRGTFSTTYGDSTSVGAVVARRASSRARRFFVSFECADDVASRLRSPNASSRDARAHASRARAERVARDRAHAASTRATRRDARRDAARRRCVAMCCVTVSLAPRFTCARARGSRARARAGARAKVARAPRRAAWRRTWTSGRT